MTGEPIDQYKDAIVHMLVGGTMIRVVSLCIAAITFQRPWIIKFKLLLSITQLSTTSITQLALLNSV